MIAKFVLPWFGGSAAVWSASLLFFQLLLLAGYLYAHCLIRYLKPKQQMTVHLHAAPDQPGHAADYSQGLLEARRRKRSVAGHPSAAGRHRRAALHPAFGDQPVAPGLVSANEGQRDSLPPVRAFQLRIDAGAAELSISGRTQHRAAFTGPPLVRRLRRVRRGLRLGSLEKPQRDRRVTEPPRKRMPRRPVSPPSFCGSRWPPALPRCCWRLQVT